MTTTKKRKSALNTTNLKAKAVKKTRVKKDNTPVHLRDSSYTQKKSFNDIKKISQDFLADRITDLTKVQKFVIPMTQHAVKLIMNFQVEELVPSQFIMQIQRKCIIFLIGNH